MSGEHKNVKAELRSGDFGGCLVDGSAEERARGRKIKRRAIVISVVAQSAAMAALVIAPLLAKPAELVRQITVPIPPYSHNTSQRQTNPHPHTQTKAPCVFCPGMTIAPISRVISDPIPEPNGPEVPLGLGAETKTGFVNALDTRVQPAKPEPPTETKRIKIGHIDPALLVRRVEPAYPPIPRQLHRAGKVELRAVIAVDGTVQSLSVVSGDPLFVPSALEAVRQWRYRPTLLNGQPVEIDTFITVIYTLTSQ